MPQSYRSAAASLAPQRLNVLGEHYYYLQNLVGSGGVGDQAGLASGVG